jgi:chemotaxis protein CheD
MPNAELVRERRYLQPGQLLVCVRPAAITTILGSCIAVCLWDPHRGVGGMNHFMLPMAGISAASSPRFGPPAMEQLVERMRDAGARLPLMRARVFGGACMFEQMQTPAHLGQKNAAVALEFLERRGVEIVQTDVGGNRGRKLIFHTDEGTSWLTLI